jgi:hypothetical protein
MLPLDTDEVAVRVAVAYEIESIAAA